MSEQFEFGVPGLSGIGIPRLEVRIVFKNFGAWSFKSDSGLGQRSVRLQKRESGGPELDVLM